jgi:hypothetical protein
MSLKQPTQERSRRKEVCLEGRRQKEHFVEGSGERTVKVTGNSSDGRQRMTFLGTDHNDVVHFKDRSMPPRFQPQVSAMTISVTAGPEM